MNNFDIRKIFCPDRLRRLSSEATSTPRKSPAYSKDSLKKSMNDLLTEIVSSLSPEASTVSLDSAEYVDSKILH